VDEGLERVLTVSENLAASLTPADLDSTLSNITTAAVATLPLVDYASITVKHRKGEIDSYALTDELLRELDHKQIELQEGPCFEGATREPYVVSSDLRNDSRFPRYGPVAVAAGIRSQAGLRLYENPKTIGALNLYSRSIGAFDDSGALGRLFAHQAAVAIAYAGQLENLHEAIRSRTTIGQAVGIVMERYRLSEDRAFAFLTRLSQHRNVKLRQVAEEIVAAVHERSAEENAEADAEAAEDR
jgi:hypothetical protein